MEALYSEKLTKRFLMGLADGVYLMSNVGTSPRHPLYAGVVVSQQSRDQQWEKIKKAGVSGRVCSVFRTKAECVKSLESARNDADKKAQPARDRGGTVLTLSREEWVAAAAVVRAKGLSTGKG